MRYSPITGMNTSRQPLMIPGAESGNVIWRNVAHGARPEVAGRLEERPVEPLQADEDRQGHERQVVVDDAQEDGERRVQQLHIDADGLQDARHAVGPEDEHPGVGPDQEARPERDDDERHQDGLPRPSPRRKDVGQRIAEQQAQHGPAEGQRDRVGEGREPGREACVLLQRQRRFVPAVGRPLPERDDRQEHERRDEEQPVPERGRQQEEPATDPSPTRPARRGAARTVRDDAVYDEALILAHVSARSGLLYVALTAYSSLARRSSLG